MPYIAIRNNIVAKKTTALVLLFNKNVTKLVYLWPNMGQKCFKVLSFTIPILYTRPLQYLQNFPQKFCRLGETGKNNQIKTILNCVRN